MKIKPFAILIFCLFLSVPAFGAQTEISLDSAYIEDDTVVLKGKVTNPVKEQQLVFLAQEVLDETNKNLYINQTDANCDSEGNFEVNFNLAFLYLDSKGVYKARLGGTNIDTPCEMLMVFAGGEIQVLWGDVNLDGELTAEDAAITLQYVLTRLNLSPAQLKAMRVNGTDEVTAENAAQILSKTLNSMYKFPVEE